MNGEHAADRLTPREDHARYETDQPVLYAVAEGIATVDAEPAEFNNAQNWQMTYALDAAFRRAVDDDCSQGHRAARRRQALQRRPRHRHARPATCDKTFDRVQLWWDHSNKPGGEPLYAREQEVYLGMCRRWRDLPKPTIAMVQGALHRRRADAGLGLRPDRRRRRRLLPGPGGAHGRAGRRVLRACAGAEPAHRQGVPVPRRTHDGRARLHDGHGQPRRAARAARGRRPTPLPRASRRSHVWGWRWPSRC